MSVQKEPPDKRMRPDRAEKIKERRNGEENVVKCTLGRIIVDKDNRDNIIKAVRERVDSVSKRTYLASVAVNRILKALFDGVPDAELHVVGVPSIDQNFIRQLMVGSRQAHSNTRDSTVEKFFQDNSWFSENIEGREVRTCRMDPTTEPTRTQKIEALRAALAAHPDYLAQFNDLHPPHVPGPLTLEEALIETRHRSVTNMDTIPTTGPWYGLRHKFGLSCSHEARISHVMHYLL